MPLSLPSSLVGVAYTPEQVVSTLELIGATVTVAGDVATVIPPTWRPDLTDGPIFRVGTWVQLHNDSINAVSTALLTLVTIILVWVAIRQFTTTRAQLRAYVSVNLDKSRAPIINAQTGPTVVLVAKNSGQTPAFAASHWVMQGIGPYPNPNPLDDPGKDLAFGKADIAIGGAISLVPSSLALSLQRKSLG